MTPTPIRVFLIDDHPIVEAGLKLGFSLSPEFSLIGTARNHDHALDRIEGLQPDVIISDLVIDGDLDLAYLTQYRETVPSARIVAFSSLPEDTYGEKCRSAGADGYISKSTSPHDIAAALRDILKSAQSQLPSIGQTSTSDQLIVDGITLTPRESEVGLRLAQGQSTVDIAEDLGISKKTAAIHRDNLRTKLQCGSSNELIALLARSVGSRVG